VADCHFTGKFQQMRLVYWVGGLAACAASGMLGLAAGINLNPTSTVKFVPDGSVFADWLSGVGTVFAAFVALYLADRQRRDNTAKIEISQYFSRDNLTIDLVSIGEKPAVVKGIFIRSKRTRKQAKLNRSPISGYEKMVGRYEYGDANRLAISQSLFLDIAIELEHEFGSRNFDGLLLVVGTATAEFRAELDGDFIQALRKELADV
jgi:hypothetical protein